MNLSGDRSAVRAIAEQESVRLAATDPTLSHWRNAVAGAPVLVHTLTGSPSYWLVPIEAADAARGNSRQPILGFIRVALNGRVAAAGRMGGRPRVVTGITEEEARTAAAKAAPGAEIGVPLFVHDGPPGREAWRVNVTLPTGAQRTLLITTGGVSEPTGGGES